MIRDSEIHLLSIFRTCSSYLHFGFEQGHPVIMEHPCGIVLNLLGPATSEPGGNILMDVDDKHPGYTHMALDVNDLQAIENTVRALGIEITEGPITLPDGGKMLFIRDPDRNVIEFHQDPPS